MPYESFIFASAGSEDPWARTAVSAGAVEEVVSSDRRRRSRGPKIRRKSDDENPPPVPEAGAEIEVAGVKPEQIKS